MTRKPPTKATRMKIQMYFAEARIDDSKSSYSRQEKRQKPNGREMVYSLVRYEFESSRRKSRGRQDWCIFQRVYPRFATTIRGN